MDFHVIVLLAAILHITIPSVVSQTVNPVSAPIRLGRVVAHTRFHAQIPDPPEGGKAKIVCIVARSRTLYICTLRRIYRIPSAGEVSMWMDVSNAISTETDRNLDDTNRAHGGVRSIAFHPQYRSNRRFYISAMESRPSNPAEFKYISDVPNPTTADGVLLEFQLNGNMEPIASTYRCVFRVGMPVYDHTIKQIAFYGEYLYIAHGDGSEQAATFGGGMQNDARGKILRINPLQPHNEDEPYSIPSQNPFVNDPNMKSEVYALGFRNPHHLCFSAYQRSDPWLFVADTGRSNIEEVNLVRRGGNYGWPAREGTFVMTGGGLISGIQPLPDDDATLGYSYPNAQVGHVGKVGDGFVGQAIAGGCPVENRSPMSGRYYYSDFPKSGELYYSLIGSLLRSKTQGNPAELTQATTYRTRICFDHDGDSNTPPVPLDSLGDVVRYDEQFKTSPRVDVRFGRGYFGELYWSSKTNGRVYLFTSSFRGGPFQTC